MKLVVGLGNPEDKYDGTRHNLGFSLLDEFRRKKDAGEWSLESKFKAEVIKIKKDEANGGTDDLLLVRPETYMNLSGIAISAIANFYKIKPEDIIVIHDELDLPLGHIKIRIGGAGAGHHGVESVIEKLGTDKFIRIRLGIGNLHSQSSERGGQSFNVEHYVLAPFMPNEKSTVKRMIKQSLKALDTLLGQGVEKAQQQFN